MSLSRSALEELCAFILNKPSTVLGNKFFDCRAAIYGEISAKADKFEPKILVISKFRVFLIGGRTPSTLKVEKSFHLLNIRGISATEEISMTFDDGSGIRKLAVRNGSISPHALATHLLTAIKHYYPDIGSQMGQTIELNPVSLYEEFSSISVDVVARPCHSFRRTYASMCDLHDLPYREEVSWDVEKIYTINKIRALRLDDFSHLLPRDLLPIVSVLQYSSYFAGLIVDGVRLSPELVDSILGIIRRSSHIVDYQLRNCGLPREFILLFATAVQNCPVSVIQSIDFSKNVLDDKKGFGQLSLVLPKMTSLRSINMSECGLSEKSVTALCAGVYNGLTSSKGGSANGVRSLLLSSSSLSHHDIPSLTNLVSLCSSLRVLDISDSGLLLDKLWPALKYGALQIEQLLFSGCQVGKKPVEYTQTVKEFFSAAVNLKKINLSNTMLNGEMLKAILLGLASNQQLKPYDLILDSTCDKGCGAVLEVSLVGLRCRSISLRDNNLDSELQGVLTALCNMPTLLKVDLGGGNLTNLRRSTKPQHSTVLNRILLDIVKLYSDDSAVEELILSKAQLGSHISVLLNTLGATTSLRHLDISQNDMGNFGARILSKALQLNVSLHSVAFDNNRIGVEGFNDIATALNTNFTLQNIPYPVNDVLECKAKNEFARCQQALSQIETALERNRSLEVVEMANQKRTLNGGLQSLLDMNTSMAQTVEEVVVSMGKDLLGPKLEGMVSDFVDQVGLDSLQKTVQIQMRKEAAAVVRESVGKLGPLPNDYSQDLQRAEKFATNRLKELWLRDLKNVMSDWRWRELCERSEFLLRNAGSASCSSQVGSPTGSASRVPISLVESSHRPRSIIGDLVLSQSNSEEGDGKGVSLDSPPRTSQLSHLQKARPRRRKGDIKPMGGSADSESSPMSHSFDFTEMDEEIQSLNSEDSGKSEKKIPLPEKMGMKPAMLPDAALINSVKLRPTGDRVSSPKEPSSPFRTEPSAPPESPPPLPIRVKPPLSPPTLPPKPEPKPRMTLSAVEDEENANPKSRRSVADMTRIFDR